MLAELVLAFEDELATGSTGDVLGSLYMKLELGIPPDVGDTGG
jgi:hypothetical protein